MSEVKTMGKIYLMRHAERPVEDSGFYVSLTSNGMSMAVASVEHLRKLNIDYVYTSPFLRCIQTVLPFVWSCNCIFRQEYSLYEWDNLCQIKHTKEIWDEKTCNAFGLSHIRILKTYLDPDMVENENIDDFHQRLDDFVRCVRIMNANSNVLLCTHLSCINHMQGRPLDFWIAPGSIEELNDA